MIFIIFISLIGIVGLLYLDYKASMREEIEYEKWKKNIQQMIDENNKQILEMDELMKKINK